MRKLLLSLSLLSLTGCVHAQQISAVGVQVSGGIKAGPTGVCQITTSSLPLGTVGIPYSATIATLNCTAPLLFSIVGSLPTGISFNTTTGVFSGTPTVAGSAGFSVSLVDANGHPAIVPIALSIAAAPVTGAPAPPDPALTGWCTTVACTPGPGSTVTIGDTAGTALCPTTCNFTSAQLSTAVASLSCGETLAMEIQLYTVSGNLNFNKVCDQNHWITITYDPTDTNFAPEGTRVTPCYLGLASIPGYPAYPCPSPARHMPYIQKTSGAAAINIFGSYYRFVGIEWGRNNGYDLDFGILNMANAPTDVHGTPIAPCSAPDLTCMNAQPTNNIFDRNIIHGDAQRQTAKAIALGGTRWVAVIDSSIYYISETYSGGGGDAEPFGWGNGKNFTNSGWGKFTNNFESASTMGNLFCGAFTEPLSPSTGFDGVPHDFWFSQDWMYKNPLWDTQRGQTQATPVSFEGVTYPPIGDQEFFMAPSAMQLQTGQSIVLQTLMLNDSNAGINRTPGGTTTLTCGSADCGSQTTVCVGCSGGAGLGSGNYVGQNMFQITYTAPASVPTGTTVTLTRSWSTWDGRTGSIGNTRPLTASAVFTIVSGAVANQISLSPKAPDLQIQPSYSDANFNSRQFELEFTAIKNFASTGMTWKVDGTTNGSTTLGQMCSVTSVTTCITPGTNDAQVIFWSGTQTGNHTISVTSAAGTTDSSVISVSTTAPISEWDAKANTSKNGFELKCGRKFKVENIYIENDWGAEGNGNGQGGQLLLAHPFNQNGCPSNCSTSILSGNVNIGYGPFEIADGTFNLIKGVHHGAGMVVGGSNNTIGIRRVSISNILCDDCSYLHNSHGFGLNTYFDTQFNSGGATVLPWESATNPMASNITYSHITDIGDVPVNNTNHGGVFGVSENTGQATVKPFGYVMQDSFFAANTAATFFDPNGGSSCNLASGTGVNNTEARGMVPCFTAGGYTFNHLNLTGSTASPGVFLSSPIWQTAGASIGFVNYNNANGGDYRLCKGLNNPSFPCTSASLFAAGQSQAASDGTDLGADVSGLMAVELNVRNGLATPLTITTSSLPSATHNSAYSQTLSVSGGTAPYTWSTPAGLIPAGGIDILDYAAMPLPDRNNFHLSGTIVKYFRLDAGLLSWIKSSSGHPQDGELVGPDYIRQWFTEGPTFSNASGFKMYVNPPALWVRYPAPGSDNVVYTPGPNKYSTTESCGSDNLPLIDNLGVRGELTGPFNDVTWQSSFGGNIPDNTPYFLAQKWIKCTANDITQCTNEEDYWLVKGYGQVQWCPKTWNGSTYVTGTCTRETTKTTGGAPAINFPCGIPNVPIPNMPPAGAISTSATSMDLGDSTGTLSTSSVTATAGSYTFTVQVEDSLGHVAQKTFTLTVN